MPDDLPASLGLVGSDGVCRLLPDGYHYLLDNRGKAYAVIRLWLWTADGILLSRDLYHTLESRLAPDLCAVDCPLGNSVGAIGWPTGPVVASLQGPAGWGFYLLSVNCSALFS